MPVLAGCVPQTWLRDRPDRQMAYWRGWRLRARLGLPDHLEPAEVCKEFTELLS